MTQTCRFGVRRYPNGGSPACFEVFDRMTGVAVASGMRRWEAEEDTRHRNQDPSGPSAVTLRLGVAELAAVRVAVEAYLARAHDRHSQILDQLYELFTAARDDDHG